MGMIKNEVKKMKNKELIKDEKKDKYFKLEKIVIEKILFTVITIVSIFFIMFIGVCLGTLIEPAQGDNLCNYFSNGEYPDYAQTYNQQKALICKNKNNNTFKRYIIGVYI